jgi:hypothetical protein
MPTHQIVMTGLVRDKRGHDKKGVGMIGMNRTISFRNCQSALR